MHLPQSMLSKHYLLTSNQRLDLHPLLYLPQNETATCLSKIRMFDLTQIKFEFKRMFVIIKESDHEPWDEQKIVKKVHLKRIMVLILESQHS